MEETKVVDIYELMYEMSKQNAYFDLAEELHRLPTDDEVNVRVFKEALCFDYKQ